MILLALPWHKYSKYVLRFEIGTQEMSEKIGQTNKQTDKQNQVNVLLTIMESLKFSDLF